MTTESIVDNTVNPMSEKMEHKPATHERREPMHERREERPERPRGQIPPDTVFIGKKPLMAYATAVMMHFNSGQSQLTGYGLPSFISWRDAYGTWQEGTQPDCMAPLSRGQRISFGVVNAAPVADAPGTALVVWIECPSRPIPRYPIVTPPTLSG